MYNNFHNDFSEIHRVKKRSRFLSPDRDRIYARHLVVLFVRIYRVCREGMSTKKDGAILKAPSMRWCLSRYYVEADSHLYA